jgi:AraC family carnitine catabolism transcriptional activator
VRDGGLDGIGQEIDHSNMARSTAIPPHRQPSRLDVSEGEVLRYGFLLLPEFPIYALIPAIEALRIANQNRGRQLYHWQLFSVDGQPVPAGNGMALKVDAAIGDVRWCPFVFVCAGNHPTKNIDKRVLSWLRRLARHGSTLGAIDTGAFALAKAGLLQGFRCAVHWEVAGTFRELYPSIEVSEQLFVIDRERITCAGGNATLDLMLHLIARRHGSSLAQIVANGFVAQRIRRESEPQRIEAADVSGDHRSPFTRILHDMEENLGTPLSANELADRAGVSLRALGRILKDRVGESPMRYYLKVRLQAARRSLFYSDIPIQEIARSCGFASPEVLSRTFRTHFGMSPREFRQRFASEQLRQFRPELNQLLERR